MSAPTCPRCPAGHNLLGPWCPYDAAPALLPILAAARERLARPGAWYQTYRYLPDDPVRRWAYGRRGDTCPQSLDEVSEPMDALGIEAALYLAANRDIVLTHAAWLVLCQEHESHRPTGPLSVAWPSLCEWDGAKVGTVESVLDRIDGAAARLRVAIAATPTAAAQDRQMFLALDVGLPETRHVYRCARCQTPHDGGVSFDCVCGAMVDYWGGEALPVDLPEEVEDELWHAANFGGAR